jgi:hypothetical protein
VLHVLLDRTPILQVFAHTHRAESWSNCLSAFMFVSYSSSFIVAEDLYTHNHKRDFLRLFSWSRTIKTKIPLSCVENSHYHASRTTKNKINCFLGRLGIALQICQFYISTVCDVFDVVNTSQIVLTDR